MNTSTYKSGSIEQISVTVDGYDEKALLTRFKGSRLWSVRGGVYGEQYNVECYDGAKTQFLKSTALELAEQFIRTGRAFL